MSEHRRPRAQHDTSAPISVRGIDTPWWGYDQCGEGHDPERQMHGREREEGIA